MTTETITEYETKEVQKEVTYSDLSGREIPEGDVVTLAVNPRIRKRRPKYECDGEIHLHVDELNEIEGIDPDDIDADAKLPEWYVKKKSPEVVIRPWVELRVTDGVFIPLFFILTAVSSLLTYFELVNGLIPPTELSYVEAAFYVASVLGGLGSAILLFLGIIGVILKCVEDA